MSFTGADRLPSRRAKARRTAAVVIIVVLAVASVTTASVLALAAKHQISVRASSASADSDLDALANRNSKAVTWRSGSSTVGAWVELTLPTQRSVNRLSISSAGERSFKSARVSFSDGSALLVTTNRMGDVDTDFPARLITTARLTFTDGIGGSRSIALSHVSLSTTTGGNQFGDFSPVATASSNAAGSSAKALTDGNPDSSNYGAEWRASPSASRAEATLTWSRPREIASVRVWGPSAAAFDGSYSAAAALNGYLEFSDGSIVRISGIAGGSGGPSTIAFTPRMTTYVSAVLERTIPQAVIGLRAIKAYSADQVPPVSSASAVTALPQEQPQISGGTTCTDTSPAVGKAAEGVIALVCPSIGTSVGTRASIVVATSAGAFVTATTASTTSGRSGLGIETTQLASATAGADGRAQLTFLTKALPHGPLAIAVSATSEKSLRTLHLQLYNVGGITTTAPVTDKDKTLVFDDEFNERTTLSSSANTATYGALKPENWGGSQFGDAVFDDPTYNAGTFSNVDKSYLRIRAQPIGDRTDPGGYHRKYLGGLLSSLHVGATGFSAQYGYYEVRMLAPAGNGTWPAFWMMNGDSATRENATYSEVDAVELYGHRTDQTCSAIHSYRGDTQRGDGRCISTSLRDDWALTWHTYGVQISPGQARFFIDDKPILTETGLTDSDKPFFFMVNLALGGGWPVDLSPTGGVADLWIDYIRVYV